MTFQLFTLGETIIVAAGEDGVIVRSTKPEVKVSQKETWPQHVISLPRAWKTAIQIEQLLERGIAESRNDTLRLPYEQIEEAASEELDLTADWVQPAPFLLKIDRHSDLGLRDFRYRFQLLEEGRPAVTERLGCFIKRLASQTIFRLEPQMHGLIEAMEDFNSASAHDDATQQQAWLTFAKVKGCARAIGAALDKTLAKVDVVVPSTLGLDMCENDDGSLTFLPKCPELGETDFQQVFERNTEVEGLYSIDRPGLGRVRVVLSDTQKEVLKRMKRVTSVSGSLKDDLVANPAQVFDGLLDAIDLPYSDRVIGIGEFQFAPVPRAQTSKSEMAGIVDEIPLAVGAHIGPYIEPPLQDVEKTDTSAISISTDATQLATTAGTSTTAASKDEQRLHVGKKFLLIETHEESVGEHFLEAAKHATCTATSLQPFQRPQSLLSTFDLHPHQQAGVHWLQICRSIQDRRGVLLADDMGLGKTLQILTFLSWAIESSTFPDLSRNEPPYRPILIVVPLILLENRTWEAEMEKFFQGAGSVFRPTLQLHGKEIEGFRYRGAASETDIGKPTLDLDKLQRYRVVLTNYETVRNYQHSFAYQKNGKPLWSIIVTDEAQEYKVPNSKISHALKAITSDFEIASTGTPVENRLLDLWNIMDALQPGILQSAKEFTHKYEKPTDAVARNQCLLDLKKELLVQKPHAFLLRREKSHVTSLPKKNVVRLTCDMMPHEIECHLSLIRELQADREPAKFLVALHKFSRMYQHPVLATKECDDLTATELVAGSSKLRRVIEECHRIRIKREKAIIFARHIAVQSLLAKVLQEEFRIPVRIINGATTKGPRTSLSSTRSGILEEFRSKQGFNLLILSPFVAGIGLTITEANHVFHYGRWWNPAVESQATDRVYRIGQDKEVFVYLPILKDSTGRVPVSFDERLDSLMERKYSLAQDFLAPLPPEDSIASELGAELLGE